ncbi:tyrosine-type recombinase/integrase [Corynebacterium crudilactis]|uniref:Tyr recombinase domain-containing protein n=1 Tax=Corynebacterium crudilactis TaxID=1652495 RepID=A0A172QXL7_9CORY|nr:tyrosine-type recombinase/integrase [Corynebacterium crudilactis]ANE05444.1 hypothetical protein ccrud_13975 [Corynebacterium crudilactis]
MDEQNENSKKPNTKQKTEMVETIGEEFRYKWRTGTEVETITQLATWFLSRCQGQRKSPNTIRSYRNAINSMGRILSDISGEPANALPIELINRNDLGDAFNEYATTRAPSSQQQCWTVWNSMCQLLVDYEMSERNPMGQVVTAANNFANRIPTPLSSEDVDQLLRTLASDVEYNGDFTSPHPARWRERDHAMILLFLVTGMRESELCGIDFKDIKEIYEEPGARTLKIRGKGNKERVQIFEKEVSKVLEDYLESRRLKLPVEEGRSENIWKYWKPNDPVFVNHLGQRITPSTVYYRVKYAFDVAGITGSRSQGALVHQLRHTVATMLANDPNVTIHELKHLLGHESLRSTERYTRGAGKATRDAARSNPVYNMLD